MSSPNDSNISDHLNDLEFTLYEKGSKPKNQDELIKGHHYKALQEKNRSIKKSILNIQIFTQKFKNSHRK